MNGDWDASTGEIGPPGGGSGYWAPEPERPESWHRLNAACFHALEEFEGKIADWARDYETQKGRPPSTMNRQKNRAAFRRLLVTTYGRGEPDAAWLEQRIGHLEKRGLAPERKEQWR